MTAMSVIGLVAWFLAAVVCIVREDVSRFDRVLLFVSGFWVTFFGFTLLGLLE